ncbi:MAG: exodeoxyribonuclease VII small subunit [Anaerolineales bacterium]|jgi:exodeoxyribonuclease VII small subunit
MAKAKLTAPKDFGYEDAFDELEALVEQLESGELQLEEALSVFERGQALAARCSDLLEKAQLRLTELAPSEDGNLSPVDFELD